MKNILAVLTIILFPAMCFGQNQYPWDLRQRYKDIPIKTNNPMSWSSKEFSAPELRFFIDTLPYVFYAEYSKAKVKKRFFYYRGAGESLTEDSIFAGSILPFSQHAGDSAEEIFIIPLDTACPYYYIVCYYNGRFASLILYDQHKAGDSIVGNCQTIEDWPVTNIKGLVEFYNWDLAKIFTKMQSIPQIARKDSMPHALTAWNGHTKNIRLDTTGTIDFGKTHSKDTFSALALVQPTTAPVRISSGIVPEKTITVPLLFTKEAADKKMRDRQDSLLALRREKRRLDSIDFVTRIADSMALANELAKQTALLSTQQAKVREHARHDSLVLVRQRFVTDSIRQFLFQDSVRKKFVADSLFKVEQQVAAKAREKAKNDSLIALVKRKEFVADSLNQELAKQNRQKWQRYGDSIAAAVIQAYQDSMAKKSQATVTPEVTAPPPPASSDEYIYSRPRVIRYKDGTYSRPTVIRSKKPK